MSNSIKVCHSKLDHSQVQRVDQETPDSPKFLGFYSYQVVPLVSDKGVTFRRWAGCLHCNKRPREEEDRIGVLLFCDKVKLKDSHFIILLIQGEQLNPVSYWIQHRQREVSRPAWPAWPAWPHMALCRGNLSSIHTQRWLYCVLSDYTAMPCDSPTT